MKPRFRPDATSKLPVYRQVADYLKDEIVSGRLPRGGRIPTTRKLAEQLDLNRATILAAFRYLEEHRLIRSYIGRGSFVVGKPSETAAAETFINFASGKQLAESYPLDLFRLSCEETLAGATLGGVLQLGSAYGYAPLRRYLFDQARAAKLAGADDDVLVTSGCQQALDLLCRVLVRPGDAVVVEDPVYPGLRQVFENAGARLAGVPLGDEGISLEHLAGVMEAERPRLMVLTPNFQNPTGATMSERVRTRVVEMARRAGVTLIENDTYAGLRYRGAELPAMKTMGARDTVLLRTFSKVSFPGLRVGWAIAPRALVARLAEAKRLSDLHSDNFSQAVLLRFAESGRMEAHLERLVKKGAQQLTALLAALRKNMPAGSYWSEPDGGMHVWVRLPEGLDATRLAERAARDGVRFTPGRYFEVRRSAGSALRLTFAGVPLEEIRVGVETLGRIFKQEAAREPALERMAEPSPILV